MALLTACNYLKHSAIQDEYKRLQKADPSQRNLKHMVDRLNFAVIGQTIDAKGLYGLDRDAKAVVAFSSRFKANELVDVMHDVSAGTHFGLTLPAGAYEILVLSDLDQNGFYERAEAIGRSRLTLSKDRVPSMVVVQHLVELGEPSDVGWETKIAVERINRSKRSLFFPAGTIRDFDDPIFSSEMATLGLYEPAAFFEQAPTMFYALEEEVGYKIPVVFVHGIGGTAREFAPIVRLLDRARFKPWFFHYSSGGDLEQLGELFYEIFLSGDKVARNELVPTVIVAHSMGGLLVRKALDRLKSAGHDYAPIEFISLATPFGGSPSARLVRGSRSMVLPSWRCLDPEGKFIQQLFRQPLPDAVTHHLFYAYNNTALVKFGENSDGVVPLSSQLHAPAQLQASHSLGLNLSHAGIRDDPVAIEAILKIVTAVETRIPDAHMRSFLAGGFEVSVGGDYSEMDQFLLRHYGRYLESLARGELQPQNADEMQLRRMLLGEVEPEFDLAKAWLKFKNNKSGELLGR